MPSSSYSSASSSGSSSSGWRGWSLGWWLLAASLASAAAALLSHYALHPPPTAPPSSASSALRGRGRRAWRPPGTSAVDSAASPMPSSSPRSGRPLLDPVMLTGDTSPSAVVRQLRARQMEAKGEGLIGAGRAAAEELDPFPHLRLPLQSPSAATSPPAPPSNACSLLPSSHPLRSLLVACPSSVASAPGKVLLTGGYLVLDRSFSGLVLSLDAAFHSSLTPVADQALLSLLATPSPPTALADARRALQASGSADDLLAVFLLHAPQRGGGVVEYWVRVRQGDGAAPGGGDGEQLLGSTFVERHPADSEDNPFVSTSLYYALHLLSSILPSADLRARLSVPVLLTVHGDSSFYSAEPASSSSASPAAPSASDGKTGLGSSATLVASLITALFQHFHLLNEHSPSFTLPPAWAPAAVAADAGAATGSVEVGGSAVSIYAEPRPVASVDASFILVNSADLSTQSSRTSSGEPTASTATSTRPLALVTSTSPPSSAAPLSFLPSSSSSSSSSFSLPLSTRVSVAHHMSQLVHCMAQGKVGSGFDVAAAFYGSHVYTRFSPRCIQPVLDAADAAQQRGEQPHIDRQLLVRTLLPTASSHPLQWEVAGEHSNGSPRSASSSSSSSSSSPSTPLSRTPSPLTPLQSSSYALLPGAAVEWDELIAPLALPSCLHLLLVDVQGGAKTPHMVQRVLQWRTQHAAAASELWRRLSVAVQEVEALLRQLRSVEDGTVAAAATQQRQRRTLQRLAALPCSQWESLLSSPPSDVSAPLLSSLLTLSSRFLLLRRLYREMGAACGVLIEPPAQTALCDWTMQQAGVLAASVPGAGGEDAIVVLAIVEPQAAEDSGQTESTSAAAALRSRLSTAWQRFCADTGDARRIRPLAVQVVREGGGVRHENRTMDLSRLSILRTSQPA